LFISNRYRPPIPMPRWVILGLWVVAHIRVRVEAVRVVLLGIGASKLAGDWIVPTEVVVQQSTLAIQALTRVVVRGGHRAPRVVHWAIWLVQLHCYDGATIVDRHYDVAEQVRHQVGERPVDLLREALAVDAVVLGCGGPVCLVNCNYSVGA
jgi:hypothetical protein